MRACVHVQHVPHGFCARPCRISLLQQVSCSRGILTSTDRTCCVHSRIHAILNTWHVLVPARCVRPASKAVRHIYRILHLLHATSCITIIATPQQLSNTVEA